MTEKLSHKYLILGNEQVGKMSLLSRFFEDSFGEEVQSRDNLMKEYNYQGKEIKLTAWKSTKNMPSSYYRGADGYLVLYDVTNMSTFESIKNWLVNIEKFGKTRPAIIIVGTKIDLNEEKIVEYANLENYCDNLNIPFFETSAKSNTNVTECFHTLINLVMDIQADEAKKKNDKNSGNNNTNNTNNSNGKKKKEKKDCIVS